MAIFYPILYGLWPMTAIFFRNTQKCTIYALYIACTYYTLHVHIIQNVQLGTLYLHCINKLHRLRRLP